MPDFYLSSSEYESWREVRGRTVLGRLSGPRARGYWWVTAEPPVPGSLCGMGEDAAELVLAERYREDDLARLGDEAVVVYVCAILNYQAVESGVISGEDIQLVAWAEVARLPSLLPTEQE